MLALEKKLDPIGKNILRRQNPLELVFDNISTFEAENPRIGSLLRERNVKKGFLLMKVLALDVMKGSQTSPRDYEIQNQLSTLKNRQEPKNNNNNNLSPPPSSPFFSPSPPAPFILPPPAPFQPPPSVFDSFEPQAPRADNRFQPPPSIFDLFQQPAPRTQKFWKFSCPPPPPPPSDSRSFFFQET